MIFYSSDRLSVGLFSFFYIMGSFGCLLEFVGWENSGPMGRLGPIYNFLFGFCFVFFSTEFRYFALPYI